MHILALGLGAGASPYAPGTVGTLVALPIYYFLMQLPVLVYLLICIILFVAGIFICDKTANDMGVHDHPAIVFDEVVGMLFVLALVPAGWSWLALGFVYFRLFDIWKPWPIRTLDKKVPGGFGIMVDDLLAAIYAWLGLQGSFLVYSYLNF